MPPFHNLLSLTSQDGQVIPIEAQDASLKFHPRRQALLIDSSSLGDDTVNQFHRRFVQKYQINPVSVQHPTDLITQPVAQSGRRGLHQDADVVVAPRSCFTLCSRSEEIC